MKFQPLCIALFICFYSLFAQEATIKETQKTLNTYGFSDPNPVANQATIYPYFRFDGYTDKGTPQAWKFVELENKYIKVSVTPEIGGKIWGAYEKSTNFPFVYFNNAVKFRDIAMRGPYTSGGIEINFGDVGHDPTVANPVDYFNRTNPDGSVSCFVGAYDWAARTRWMVEINLPKDKAVFTTKSHWFNANPLDQTYYHWMNAAFKAGDDLEVSFPGTNYIDHGGIPYSWPQKEDGKRINFYKENNFGTYKSYHVVGNVADFYSGYWHNSKVGFVHYSPYHEKLGKKIWIWGLSREGMIWDNLLTDTDGQYVELQSGKLFNQPMADSFNSPFKFVAFPPYASDSWQEHWYPIKNTGGITQAKAWGAWNITQKSEYLVYTISPSEAIADTLKVSNTGKISKKFIQLQALQTYKDSVKTNLNSPTEIMLGSTKLYGKTPENQNPERPMLAPKDFDWKAEYGQFLMAKSLGNQRRFLESEEAFNALLKQNQYHVPALGELSQLLYRKGMYTQAIENAKKGLSVNTYDPLCNYMLGLAALAVNNLEAARDGFSVAVLSNAYKAASLTELCKIAIIQNDFSEALNIANQALEANPKNEHAQHLKLAILRKTKNSKEANILIEKMLLENPLDHLARVEKYLLSKSESDKITIVSNIKNELPQENFIEMALWYEAIQDHAAAGEVLNQAPKHPMVNLWKGQISKNNDQINQALQMSPYLVFPFRQEDLALFESIISNKAIEPNWKQNYYYGLVLSKFNRTAEAKNQFELCGEKPDFTPFYLAKANLFKDDSQISQKALEKAYQLSPENWRVVKQLADFLIEKKEYKKALEINQKAPRKILHEAYILDQQKAALLAHLGEYLQCIEFMKKLVLLPSEGASGAHFLYRKVNIQYAIQLIKSKKEIQSKIYLDQAETWPENLGSGAPYEPDNKLTTALKAYIKKPNSTDLAKLKETLSEGDKELLKELSN
jgi:lipopolysaccharide biosynthesis regulator YciM